MRNCGFFFLMNNGIMRFMKTIIKKIDKNQIEEQVIEQAGKVLKNGGLVAFPTETVYGLGADALNEKAAGKTYEAKGRPSDNPLIIHIAEFSYLDKIVSNIPKKAVELAEKFWPGPLTMIFEKSEIVPYGTTGGLETVAVRMPDDAAARALIAAGGGYVSAPSANTSGRPSPTSAKHVEEDMDGRIDMILDGGSVDIGVESTIVDMTVEPPMILRPGAVTKEMLEEVIGDVQVDAALLNENSAEAPKAPGMKYRHYAPKAILKIVQGTMQEEVHAIKQLAYEKHREGKKVGIIASSETFPKYTTGIVKNIGTRENQVSIAKNLYKVLREFDEEDIDYIYSESFAIDGIGQAIMNRLEKAAGHQVLDAAEIASKQKYRRVIFVSKSDNSRGPMAAELLRNQELVQEYEIDSRGMIVLFPEPPNPKAQAIMKSQQMTLEGHETVLFGESDLDEDTLVLTMEESQKWKIITDYEYVKHVYTLSEYVEIEKEIPSAYGQPLTEYGKSFEILKEMIQKLAEKLNDAAKKQTYRRKNMSKVHVMDHPLIRHKISYIRREDLGSKDFREMISEIAMLICYEATRDLKLQDVKIKTPICETVEKELAGKKLAVVPILRAGLGMVEGMLAMIPAAKVGHIGLYRDPETLKAVEYFCKLPADCEDRDVFVVDPMLATGASSVAAIQMLKDRGVKNIRFLCIIAAPEGVKRMQEAHPDVDIYIGVLDEKLNEHGYIVPGLGDAGDRIFGTK